MATFQFIDTFFFISLGITFALLLLLVYHFKQRISSIEQKTDTLFEIIQNITKELSVTKANIIYLLNKASFSNPIEVPVTIDTKQNITFEKEQEDDEDDEEQDEDEDEDEDDDDEEDDEDENDDEDEEDDEDDEDDDEDEEDYEDEDEKINFDLEEDTQLYEKIKIPEEDVKSFEEDIKIIKLSSDLKVDELEEIYELTEKIETTEEQELLDNELDITEIVPENIIVNKIQDENSEKYDLEKEEKHITQDIEVYKKMNLTSLRTLVISKGLCSDASKMKKNELLQLLTTE